MALQSLFLLLQLLSDPLRASPSPLRPRHRRHLRVQDFRTSGAHARGGQGNCQQSERKRTVLETILFRSWTRFASRLAAEMVEMVEARESNDRRKSTIFWMLRRRRVLLSFREIRSGLVSIRWRATARSLSGAASGTAGPRIRTRDQVCICAPPISTINLFFPVVPRSFQSYTLNCSFLLFLPIFFSFFSQT